MLHELVENVAKEELTSAIMLALDENRNDKMVLGNYDVNAMKQRQFVEIFLE